jgi:hypothetical protein
MPLEEFVAGSPRALWALAVTPVFIIATASKAIDPDLEV